MSAFGPIGRPPRPGGGGAGEQGPVLTVAELVRLAKAHLEAEFGGLWVEGEVADLAQPRSGHLYFALHDGVDDASVKAVMWASDARRLRFKPEDGALVRALGTLTIYEPRGAFQLRVSRLALVGEGDLRRRFEQVRADLEARGLLDPERKRPLPRTPRRIGVVTSRDGAALRDILKVLGDRLPTPVLISHAAVQGETAPGEIVAALGRLARVPDVEVVIVGRGGGGGDDLWAWNDLAVALAIAAHPVPVVAAIGHQTDMTIADLVADCRAATPSEAAVLVAPERAALARAVANIGLRIVRAERRLVRDLGASHEELRRRLPPARQLLEARWQRTDELARALEERSRARVAAERARLHGLQVRLAALHPGSRLARSRATVAALTGRLRTRAAVEIERSRARLGRTAAALAELSPLGVLARGYATVHLGGASRPMTDASAASPGDAVEIRLSRGALGCTVTRVEGGPREGGATG